MERDLFCDNTLFCPGPTPVPESIAQAGLGTSVYHRDKDFYQLFANCQQHLQKIIQTKNLPLILTSSGTGAMEAALINLTNPDDQIIAVTAGKFGQRWQEIAETYGCKVNTLECEWGKAPSPASVCKLVHEVPDCRAVFLQANETSTGAKFPVELIAKELRQKNYSGLIIVDAISSLCAHTMAMDDWDIDCVVGGSQKGFGVPPGLAFIALSERAQKSFSTRKCFYFNMRKELIGQKEGQSCFTPATTLIIQLQLALERINKIDIHTLVKHHQYLAEACRKGGQAIGLELFASECPSDALTSFKVPAAVDGQKLIANLRKQYGAYFAGGQSQLKGKIIRFAHLGFVNKFHLLHGFAALEFALQQAGYEQNQGSDLGKSVAAAMQSLAVLPEP